MQSILFNAVMTGASTRTDGSVSLRLSTGELVPEDKLAIFNLQNIPCEVTLAPNDADAQPPREIKGELSKRTCSERIRAVIFCFFKAAGEPGSFDLFYAAECEKIINGYKAKLPQTPF